MHPKTESVFRRLDNLTILEHYTTKKVTRPEHIRLLESCYNFGPTFFPRMVSIELLSTCNLGCSICQYPTMRRPHKKMKPDLAKKIITECAKYNVWYLTFAGYGEPTLAPEYYAEMIQFAKNAGIECVSIPTNMTLMTDEIMKLWIESGLDGITFSFEGTSKEKYEEVRNANFEKTVANIKNSFFVRQAMNKKTPFMSINCIKTSESTEEIENFKKEFSPFVDRIGIHELSFHAGKTPASKRYAHLRENDSAFSTKIPCRQLGARLNVYSNGETTPCCNGMEAELSLGNAEKYSIYELWNSKKFGEMFMASRQLRWKDLPALCHNCPDATWAYHESDQETLDDRYKK